MILLDTVQVDQFVVTRSRGFLSEKADDLASAAGGLTINQSEPSCCQAVLWKTE